MTAGTETVQRNAVIILSHALCLLGLLTGLLAAFFAHPLLATGIWRNTEGVNIVILAGASLCLGGLALRPHQRHLRHPTLIVLLGLAGWSLLSAPFADYPLTSLLGPPQTMYGALWFVAQAAFLAAGLHLLACPRLFRATVGLAVIVALILLWSNLRYAPWLSDILPPELLTGRPLLGFNDYLGYPALALAVIGGALCRTGRRWGGAAILTLAAALLAIAGSRAAGTAATLMLLALLLIRLTAPLWRHRNRASALTLGVTATLPLTVYGLIRFWPAGELPPSLESRRVLFAVLDPALWMDGLSLLVGKGWGHFDFQLYAALPTVGVSLTAPQWIDVHRDQFHSHHAGLEALFSAGLPAATLLILLPATMVLAARPAFRSLAVGFAIALSLMESLWFQMPQTMVFTALAITALSDRRYTTGPGQIRDGQRTPVRATVLPVIGTAALAASLTAASLWQAQSAAVMDDWRTCLRRNTATCPAALPLDPRQSDLGLSVLIMESLETLDRRGWPERLQEKMKRLMTEAAGRCDRSCPTALARSLVAAQTVLAYRPAAGLFSPEQWNTAVLHLTQAVPTRIDSAAPYFNWLLSTGRSKDLAAILQTLPTVARQSPVYDWFSGILLLESPGVEDAARGLEMMRAALTAGVGNLILIEPETRAALESPR